MGTSPQDGGARLSPSGGARSDTHLLHNIVGSGERRASPTMWAEIESASGAAATRARPPVESMVEPVAVGKHVGCDRQDEQEKQEVGHRTSRSTPCVTAPQRGRWPQEATTPGRSFSDPRQARDQPSASGFWSRREGSVGTGRRLGSFDAGPFEGLRLAGLCGLARRASPGAARRLAAPKPADHLGVTPRTSGRDAHRRAVEPAERWPTESHRT